MNTILNRIILLNVELEGALRVAANRPSEEALESAKSKFAEISALFAMLNPADFMASVQQQQTEIKIEEAEEAEMDPMPEPNLKPDAQYTPYIENETETPKIIEPTREKPDLRKMFTLNDKFLFKRELFGNNDEEFNATLELLGSMESFSEAEEYIYDDLRLDENNTQVRNFMSVVKSYFA